MAYYIVVKHDNTAHEHPVSAFRFDTLESIMTWMWDRDVEDYAFLKFNDTADHPVLVQTFTDTNLAALKELLEKA